MLFGTGQLPKFAKDQFRTRKSDDLDYAPLIEELEKLDDPQLMRRFFEEGNPERLTYKLTAAQQAESRQESDLWWLDIAEDLGEGLRRQLDLWLIPTAEVSLTNLVRRINLD